MLDIKPDFLVKEEYEDVVEEGSRVNFAHIIVASTAYEDTAVGREVAHRVPKACNRTGTWSFDVHELSMNDLIIDGRRLEQSELVLRLTQSVFPSEEVYTFLDLVRLSRLQPSARLFNFFHQLYVAAPSLDEWWHAILNYELRPLIVVKVQY